MPARQWTEWLASPETKTLLAYLRRKQQGPVGQFLAGQKPVDPLTQGQAAGLHEIEKLLTASGEDVSKEFDKVLRENKST